MAKVAGQKARLPNLDKYLKGKARRFVTYTDGSRLYSIPFYSFVRLAKEAEANFILRKCAIVDLDIVERFLGEHPEVAARVDKVKEG